VHTTERSLEIAQARYNESACAQVDVLDAQSTLTQARAKYVNALRDHPVARAQLIRATGADLQKGRRQCALKLMLRQETQRDSQNPPRTVPIASRNIDCAQTKTKKPSKEFRYERRSYR
jgi:hypothetical protein